MKMFVKILCDPPLGQSTILPPSTDHIKFTVLVESSNLIRALPWEVLVWHNYQTGDQWEELVLKTDDQIEDVNLKSSHRPEAHRRFLSGSLAIYNQGGSSFKFTLKYRSDSSQPWSWVNQDQAVQDGEVMLQGRIPSNPWEVLRISKSRLAFDRVTSDVPNTKLWFAKHLIPAAGKGPSFMEDPLGLPLRQSRFFALTRLWTPWLIPQHGQSKFDVSQDAIFASFLRSDGLHLAVLALSDADHVLTVLKSSGDGTILVSSRNDGVKSSTGMVLFAIGYSSDTALAACVYYARRLVSGFSVGIPDQATDDVQMSDEVDTNWYEEWPDGLTYCTWNSLGQKLTEEKIVQAIHDLAANEIQILNLIIDDNWQSIDQSKKSHFDRGLMRFEADQEAFPNGLRETVNRIKRIMPRMQTIAVWHAILGYWGGISSSGELARKYKTRKVRRAAMQMPGKTHAEIEMTVIDDSDIDHFYSDFYTFLESCGIGGVKTDAQFLLEQFKHAEDRRSFLPAYLDAWSVSGLRHFQSKQVSSMSLAPQIIFRNQLFPDKPRLMLRNSDDFYPDEPESHPWHIFTNALTATFTQYLNVIPDWDMFQTDHPWGSYHAAARCLSGGPVCITDIPAKHDFKLLSAMTALTTQGNTVTLRPSRFAKVIGSQVYNAYSDRHPLKIGNYNGGSTNGTGFLGVFNVGKDPIFEFVRIEDFPGIQPEVEYVVRAHSTGQITSPRKGKDLGPVLNLFLVQRGWEIFTSYPLSQVDGIESRVSPLGLVGKLTGSAATLRFDIELLPDDRLKMTTILKALGVLGIYVSDLANKTVLDNFLITLQGEAVPVSTVKKDTSSDCVLLIDVAQAWKDLNMHAGWGNEVIVTVYMS